MKKIAFKLVLILSFFEVGCVSMSTLQTAKTLEEGQKQQTFGGGTYQSKSGSGADTTEVNLPYMEFSYRQGFAKDLDFGVKLTILGSYAADVKYQLYAKDEFAVSSGFGLGYMSYKTTSGNVESEVKFIDAMIPLYLSYDFSKSFAVYASPKILLRSASGTSQSSDVIKGIGLGTKIGENSGVYLEAAMMQGNDGNKLTQYNASYFW